MGRLIAHIPAEVGVAGGERYNLEDVSRIAADAGRAVAQR
jgi:hypothetical protein